MDGKSLLEQKFEVLDSYLKRTGKKLLDGTFNAELSIRKHIDRGVSFKVMHTDIGNYYYVEDISVDFTNKIVTVFYLLSGEMHLRKNRLFIV